MEVTADNFASHVKGAFKITEDAVTQIKAQSDTTKKFVEESNSGASAAATNPASGAINSLVTQRVVLLTTDVQKLLLELSRKPDVLLDGANSPSSGEA